MINGRFCAPCRKRMLEILSTLQKIYAMGDFVHPFKNGMGEFVRFPGQINYLLFIFRNIFSKAKL